MSQENSGKVQEAIDRFHTTLALLVVDDSPAEVQEAIDYLYAARASVVREMSQNIKKLQEKIRLIEKLPLSERLLAWSEWNRMCRPSLTGHTVNPHALA